MIGTVFNQSFPYVGTGQAGIEAEREEKEGRRSWAKFYRFQAGRSFERQGHQGKGTQLQSLVETSLPPP